MRSSVSKIWLRSPINDKVLLELLKLEELSELHIDSTVESGRLTFNEGFIRLLEKFVRTITSLTIYNLYTRCSIDIRAIVDCCHKLESLILYNVGSISTVYQKINQAHRKRMTDVPS